MTLSFVIVDDDAASRRMLQTIIGQSGLGEVTGMAGSGAEGTAVVMEAAPDVVLIDLLMPDQDGIETITQLAGLGYTGKFIMISQIENKEMVGQAYQAGIEFFIHKPINRLEVEAVLGKVKERYTYERHIRDIRESLAMLDGKAQAEPMRKGRTVNEAAKLIFMDLGILGEAGSRDLLAIAEHLGARGETVDFPSLKELYEAAAASYRTEPAEIDKESKAMEQRIRRAVMAALSNVASIGLTDYGNPKFEHYAPLYFDFQSVRLKMREMEEGAPPEKSKVNIKKFLQVFYLDVLEKLREG